MKLTRFGFATLLVAFASLYLISQGYLVPVTIALAVILAWLHWLAAVEAERTGEPPHGPHGMLTVAAIAGVALISMVTVGQSAFWLGIGTLIAYALLLSPRAAAQRRRAAEAVKQGWESVPDLQRYLSQHPQCRTRRGIRCFHCSSDKARNWGLESRGDSRRLHICDGCSTALYRSVRQMSPPPQPRGSYVKTGEHQTINPASGLPMMPGNSGFDITGNPFGFDLYRDSERDDEHNRRSDDLWKGHLQMQQSWEESNRHAQELWEDQLQSHHHWDEANRNTQEVWDEHARHMRDEELMRDARQEQWP
ncbi:hypothetical protein [Cupriavidus basilensis]|uniref:hypothetical protein n=1 Tax=Cupriavidus basilensis TaxID=68895 RepID=UPI001184DE4F|nr:hypothetical protein [Cupriavidus basilensis]